MKRPSIDRRPRSAAPGRPPAIDRPSGIPRAVRRETFSKLFLPRFFLGGGVSTLRLFVEAFLVSVCVCVCVCVCCLFVFYRRKEGKVGAFTWFCFVKVDFSTTTTTTTTTVDSRVRLYADLPIRHRFDGRFSFFVLVFGLVAPSR